MAQRATNFTVKSITLHLHDNFNNFTNFVKTKWKYAFGTIHFILLALRGRKKKKKSQLDSDNLKNPLGLDFIVNILS